MRRIVFSVLTALVATTSIVGTAAARPVRHERHEQVEYVQDYRVTHRPRPLPARRPVVPIGAQVDIQWGSSWWAGTVLAERSGMYLVHYDGWSSSWDEWVDLSRIRPPFAVQYVEPELQPIFWNNAPVYR